MSASTGHVLGRIFMSYRREDTAYPAAWLFERLASHFGRRQVFKDLDSIELGDDFADVIITAVRSCDVLLALIGSRWLTITGQDGQRRLDDPEDFVRLEIETALTRNVRVIPILVEGARMPRSDEMPVSLAKLVRLQALELSPSRFDFDTQRLLRVLDRTITEAKEQARWEAEEAAAAHRRQMEQLQQQIRERAVAQDWDAVLAVNDQLTALDPAADPDALASTAREQITRRQEAEEAVAIQVDLFPSPPETLIINPSSDEILASTLAPLHKPETPPTAPSAPQPMQISEMAPSAPSPQPIATSPERPTSTPKLGPVKSILSILWALLPTLTIGILAPILAPIPFAHAAIRLRDQRLWLIAAAYGLGSLTMWIMWIIAIEKKWTAASLIFYLILFALGVVATIHAFKLRGRVFAPPSPPTAAHSSAPHTVP
jgi:TIR domain